MLHLCISVFVFVAESYHVGVNPFENNRIHYTDSYHTVKDVLPGNLCLAFPHAAKAPVHDGCDPLRLWRHPAIFLFDSFHAAVVVFFV